MNHWCFLATLIVTIVTGSQLKEDDKIIIIGAGMSGVNAAKTLKEMGFDNFIILEGSDRVGGRLKEATIGGYTVETGALWIHGLGTNPLYRMAKEYNLSYITTDYDDLVAFDDNGNNVTKAYENRYEDFEKAADILSAEREDMMIHRKQDTTLRQIFISAGWIANSPIDGLVEYYDYDFELSYSPDAVSAMHGTTDMNYALLNSSYKDLTVNDPRGYSHIIKSLLSDVLDVTNTSQLMFNQRVTDISQNDSHVTVRTDDNTTYVGNYVINTFSLGVMQNRLVNFHPPLPKWKMESIDQFQMAVYYHMYFQFPTKFWDDTEYILYASSRRGYYTVWQNIEKLYPGSNILLATLVGEEARRIDRMTDTDIKNEVVSVLSKIYIKKNIVVPEPTAYIIPRWLSDPLFKGSYSNWTPGYSRDMHIGLCTPVGRFYFAGEACMYNLEGYLHSAYFSGKETAESLTKCIKDSSKCETFLPEYLSRGCTYPGSSNYKAGLKTDDGSCKRPRCQTSGSTHLFQGYAFLTFVSIMYRWLLSTA